MTSTATPPVSVSATTAPHIPSTSRVYPNVRLGDGAIVGDFVIIGEPPRGAGPGDVETGERPLTDATNGLEVVRVLEAADESLRAGSRPVDIAWE